MPTLEKYRHYFDIDPDYVSAVNERVIQKHPDMWKKFFPHKTFIGLLKTTLSVLERKQKLSIWVEGSYGTGKSHAVLTLKKLLDADENAVRGYFQQYALDDDLCNRFIAVKRSGKILTVHRYGSATIHGDHNLVFAVQESVEHALADAGIENKGTSALKSATLAWLSDPDNRSYFNGLITGKYSDLFGGDNVDDLEEKLKTFKGDALSKVMDHIFRVADERQIKALSMDVSGLCDWLREIIRANGLKAIVFIWDEFTEYFYANARALTGFQELCELSETDPFYMIPVTHLTQGMFHESDQDFIKLNDRFVNPHCLIELPENIAFQLMGAAMRKNPDPVVKDNWDLVLDDLSDRTSHPRRLVKAAADISDREMLNILPIHPYAAYLLKHISATYDSNQRSMFDFIKNDRGDEIRGFQWFIDNYGPYDDNPLLTVDMLWDFFYEKGKENLARDVRAILDYYGRVVNRRLDSDQKRVLKTVLLLQAVSQHAGNAVDLFLPNADNLNNAFEGSDFMSGAAVSCAEQLVRDKVLFKKELSGGKTQYAAYNNEPDAEDLRQYEAQIDKKSTTAFITEELNDKTHVFDVISLSGALKLRYELKCVSSSDFDSALRQLRNSSERFENRIVAIACFAKDDKEGIVIRQKIRDAMINPKDHFVFIDAAGTPFGADAYEQYRESTAHSMSQQGKDNAMANQYASDAKDVLKKWRGRIASSGEFVVYAEEEPRGKRTASLDAMYQTLEQINRNRFPNCLEGTYSVIANMFTASNLKQGVESAVNQKTTGTFRSGNPATKLENALSGAWEVEDYWKKSPHLPISKIKLRVDQIIADGFEKEGRVSIKSIYDVLKAAPYGFMPCNLSAFILGFVLKEYTDGTYSYGDGLTSDVLNVTYLKDMIDEVIRLEITPNPRYRDKYIVSLTEEEKAFNDITSTAFGVPIGLCTSVPTNREHIRSKMKDYSFPIWTLKYILEREGMRTDAAVLADLIDHFCGIANSNNMGNAKTESTIAMEIGKIAMAYPQAAMDLKRLLNQEKCTQGMSAYLREFEGGRLPALAEEIRDNGQYINALREKMDADAANWVWNHDTVDQKIREVILEYEIVSESNRIISRNQSYQATIRDWCDKCDYISVSYAAMKNDVKDLAPFLELLLKLKKAGTLLDSQKQKFLDLLRAQGRNFRKFYENQVDVFEEVCAYYLDGLEKEDVKEIFGKLPAGLFTAEKKDYLNTVENQITTYKDNMKSVKLKQLWKEKTGTESPRAWSKRHAMPILCLVPDDEISRARSAFGAVNQAKPKAASVDKARDYLTDARFFRIINDEQALDQIFREKILKANSVMLPDIQEVKDYLEMHIADEPYDWFGLPQIDKLLTQMAEAKYNQGGCDLALAKIEEMDVDDVKRYLKELIRDNMTVGIEIIKGN